MFKIIVFTHGDLAKSLKETAELISGTNDHVEFFSIPLGCDTGAILSQVSASMKHSELSNTEVLVLTDLFSGTPFNLLMTLIRDHKFSHITGVNLPMLLEAISLQNQQGLPMERVISELVSKGREAIGDCNIFVHYLLEKKED
jgi:mannose/fructose-specific phosphotransferase system component IIA